MAKEKGDAIVSYVNNHNLLTWEYHKLDGVKLLSPAETRFGTTVIELDRLLLQNYDYKISYRNTKEHANADVI